MHVEESCAVFYLLQSTKKLDLSYRYRSFLILNSDINSKSVCYSLGAISYI
jgi:hypothetical protein